ncbi:hypothetical protein ABW21_db0205515 [Orbilia brochopaga]|nr:hypothetical protein ABW21_db0205515 [Drechslerella brochopaga]
MASVEVAPINTVTIDNEKFETVVEEPELTTVPITQPSVKPTYTPSIGNPDANIDYEAWDAAIVAGISSLPEAERKSRSQQFLSKHPTALKEFRTIIAQAELPWPLHSFQRHPTYLLRYLLAEWRDEETKEFRTDLALIMSKSLERVTISQKWRSGEDECWARFGYKTMDEMYEKFRHPADKEDEIYKWFFQGFYGVDKAGYPVHYELPPDTYREDWMTALIMRRLLNNEKTLRERTLQFNPSPEDGATPEQLANPRIGVTWILDARRIGLFAMPSVYKTMTGLIAYSNRYAAAHYPEQGYRAFVVNLGSVLVSIYNVAIKIMPAQTQRTTTCHGGREILDEVIGEGQVPEMFQKGKSKKVDGLTEEEVQRQREEGNAPPWVEF